MRIDRARPRPWTQARLAPVLAALIAAVAVAGCGSSAGGDGSAGADGTATTATSTSTAPTATHGSTPSTTGVATTEPDDTSGPVRRVAIVADSEIPPPVAEALDARPDVEVVHQDLHDGYTMAQLDPFIGPALATEPDVLLYAGGTNDLGSGPQAILDGLRDRLPGYADRACLVVAVPIFRYERGTPEEVAARTEGTRILERHIAAQGGRPVSYLDISLAMDARGEDFFAPGELGDMHPADHSHPAITRALAQEIRRCPLSGAG